ncbi:hypothetical protein [Curvibacter sp. PAE-UM]|uniref:hypothetical protein n=1 Tax=Curvibacter sp. PAE-UM TaxID=1714344 RepID=UPI0007109174|nr:hypothetical protein [Curvibacter sp. PAE-UM]KRH99335.1 hypothetical protein AO057_03650 [Curvibacter sp. PAE-UM]
MHPKLDDDFDLRARAELSLAYETGEPPGALFRHTPWYSRRWLQTCCVLAFVAGTLLGGVLAIRPNELVRGAIEHEYYERTLRGSFMESSTLLAQLGLEKNKPVPGYPQLMRPCDIDGKLAYHLTTFFEKGGIVTVFAFDQPVSLKEGQGWWNDVYWQVVTGRDGRPLILVSEKKKALTVAYRVFSQPPA